MTKEEIEITAALTTAAYNILALTNDYFSWEKEWQNYNADGCKGDLINSVLLYMKWYSVDATEAKKMLRSEMMARELKYCNMKAAYLGHGNTSENTIRWLRLLESVMAGNFLWSATTARYIADAEDSYPGLRAAHQEKRILGEDTSIVALIAPELSEKGVMSDEDYTSSKQLGYQKLSAEQMSSTSTSPTSIDGGSLPDTSLKEVPKLRPSMLIEVYGEVSAFDMEYLLQGLIKFIKSVPDYLGALCLS